MRTTSLSEAGRRGLMSEAGRRGQQAVVYRCLLVEMGQTCSGLESEISFWFEDAA